MIYGKLTQKFQTKGKKMKTNLIMEPIMKYIANKVTKNPVQTTKQVVQNNPKLMSAAQALAIEAAALVKKNTKKIS